MLLIRKYLDQHLNTKCPKRAYKCLHYEEKGTFASIKEDDNHVCEKKIVACPKKRSGCSLSMELGKTKEHLSCNCEYAEVACVYESLGCRVKMLRKDREEHEEDKEKHVDLSLVNVKLLTVEQKTLTKLCEEKHKPLEKSMALKDMQHLRLTEEHNSVKEK